ncbi:MAG: response regulator transcription factor [Acetatifactor sp.]
MTYKILLVEDDFALAMGTEYTLQAEGYEVLRAASLHQAESILKEDKSINLILLDVMLPDGSGYEFCRGLRDRGETLPIIFLTALSEEVNIVQGLELGADDYVTKPYRVKELLSRISANLRRAEINGVSKGSPAVYTFGHHKFMADEFRLLRDGVTVECTVSEMKLLRELLLNRGIVITRQQLLERLFDTEDIYIDDNTLSVYLKRLRDRLGADAGYIETVRGVGYRFNREDGGN